MKPHCNFCFKVKKLYAVMSNVTPEGAKSHKVCAECYHRLIANENLLFYRYHGIKFCEVCIYPLEECKCKEMMKKINKNELKKYR